MTKRTHLKNGRTIVNQSKNHIISPQPAKRPLQAQRTNPQRLIQRPTRHRPSPLSTKAPTPIFINIPPRKSRKRPCQTNTLSYYLQQGCGMHPLCRDSFIERVEIGYYHYERRTEWHTCALAAAYAGAFGSRSIERPEFSYSMAVWQLSQRLGYDLRKTAVYGPTDRCQPVVDEMIQLIDQDKWTRLGVADWLQSLNL